MADIEKLMTAVAVAQRLLVKRKTPYEWHRRGLLKAIRLPGGGLRWRESDVEALIAKKGTS